MNLYERIAQSQLDNWELPSDDLRVDLKKGLVSFGGELRNATVIRCAQLAAYRGQIKESKLKNDIDRLKKEGACWHLEVSEEGLPLVLVSGVERNDSVYVRTANEIQKIVDQCRESIELTVKEVHSATKGYRNVTMLKVKKTKNFEVRFLKELDEACCVKDWDDDVFDSLVESMAAGQRGMFSLKVHVIDLRSNVVIGEVQQGGCQLELDGKALTGTNMIERALLHRAIAMARMEGSHYLHA
ncbi:hypothetical protein NB545_20060 [Vibrio campbellii]|uniref:hypothetical protein n=1 Tax=Vibrio campbellii TaxID=680 RepID=UPI00215BDC2D|nr:hypothetical protein [Vibrio campbellii]MCR9909733.1 hypothetical protein [Vibrio campbellii]